MNPFDRLKKTTHRTITNFFGYKAVWVSSLSGVTHTAQVGFKDPSEKEYLAGLDDFNENRPYMDYFVSDFVGLKSLVDEGNGEVVTIYDKGADGIEFVKGVFDVMKITTKSDGDTYIATMQKI